MSDITAGIQLTIILQNIVFCIFLMRFSEVITNSTRIFLFLLAVFTLHMVANLALAYEPFSFVLSITKGISLLYGPLVYLYVRTSVFDEKRLALKDAIHLLPAPLITVLDGFTSVHFLVAAGLTFLSMAIYLIAAAAIYKKYIATIDLTQSLDDAIALTGIKVALFINAVILLSNMGTVALYVITQNEFLIGLSQVSLFLLLSASIVTLALTELTKDKRFHGITASDLEVLTDGKKSNNEYQIDPAVTALLENELERLMSNDKPYLQPLFNLQSLAKKLGVSPRNVSAFINQRYQKSFSEYVNQFRIEEVKQLLISDTEQTILDIAYQCGFSTKSNFNRAFKLQEGMTPSEFKESNT
ncbi:helix-turn-helix domain-containing protein [Alteromonas facilis]|uniref:helix-turn-helix domain-containing protein n=1 Tax=Alteromonas facilis TaxID=2048004 RepID=UPI000C28A12F|nr:helix-turn-helix domain-containing protein [Alteromonas facilis]